MSEKTCYNCQYMVGAGNERNECCRLSGYDIESETDRCEHYKEREEIKTYEQGKEEGRKEMLDNFKLTDEMKHKIAEQVKFMQERAEKTGDRDIWDMLELFTIIENAIKSAR